MKLYMIGLVIGIAVGVSWTLKWSTPSVHAQSATWEVIAQPEQVANVGISIVRHVTTGTCYVIIQSATGVSATSELASGGLCDTPEEYAERKRKWDQFVSGDGVTSYWRMAPDNVTYDKGILMPSQPSSGQVSKQPGLPR